MSSVACLIKNAPFPLIQQTTRARRTSSTTGRVAYYLNEKSIVLLFAYLTAHQSKLGVLILAVLPIRQIYYYLLLLIFYLKNYATPFSSIERGVFILAGLPTRRFVILYLLSIILSCLSHCASIKFGGIYSGGDANESKSITSH